jgi:hypothetical protein
LNSSDAPQSQLGGLMPGLTITVPLSVSPSTGASVTLAASSVTFDTSKGQTGVTQATTTVSPVIAGTSTVSVTQPAGFTAAVPASYLSFSIQVSAPIINISAVTVGFDTQTSEGLSLQSAPPSAVSVTVTSNGPSFALLSSNADCSSPSSSVTFKNVTTTSVGTICIIGVAQGSTTLTAQASGYTDGNAAVSVNPTGFIISTASFSTSTGAASTPISVSAWVLSPSLAIMVEQQLTSAVTVSIQSSNSGVGSTTAASFAVGATSASGAFTPSSSTTGSTTLTLVTPSGFSTPTIDQSITATVN